MTEAPNVKLELLYFEAWMIISYSNLPISGDRWGEVKKTKKNTQTPKENQMTLHQTKHWLVLT